MTKVRDKEVIKAFGNHLRGLRLKKSLSQEELAFAADIPISQIARIERGEVNTTISTITAVANALELHPKELLDFKK